MSGGAARRTIERGLGRLLDLGRRSRQVLVLSALTGAFTGLGVAGFDWVTRDELFDHLRRQPRDSNRGTNGWTRSRRRAPALAGTDIVALDGRRIHPQLPRAGHTDGSPSRGRSSLGQHRHPRLGRGHGVRGTVDLPWRSDRVGLPGPPQPHVLPRGREGTAGCRGCRRGGGDLQGPGDRTGFAPEVPYQQDFARRHAPAGRRRRR